jgi:hypothetical protein
MKDKYPKNSGSLEGGKVMREASFTKALTVAFSQETFGKIKAITDHKKISMGEWVRIAVERAFTETEVQENREGGEE